MPFLLRHPAHFIALGFGAGLAPVAPGTFGTLVAIPIALLLRALCRRRRYSSPRSSSCSRVGVWAAQVTGRDLGVPDHGAIVIDEVVGVPARALLRRRRTALRVAFAFLLFRLFDIVKPPPIRQLDAALKNGVGVMLDDLLAAGYTLLVFALWQRLFG